MATRIAVEEDVAFVIHAHAEARVPVAEALAVSRDRTPGLVSGTVLLDTIQTLENTI